MGMKHSFPIPKEEDFHAFASDGQKPTTMPPPLCQAISMTTSAAPHDVRFVLSSQAWNNTHGTPTVIPELGVKLVVAKDDKEDGTKEPLLLILQSHSGGNDTQPFVVLRQPQQYSRPLQICTLVPPTAAADNKPHVVTHYRGHALYEYATVDKIRNDQQQYVLRRTANNDHDDNTSATLLWRTNTCGSLGDKIIHAVESVNAPTSSSSLSFSKPKHSVRLGAYLQAQSQQTWHVRVAENVDPLVMLCFVVCLDRWHVREAVFFRQASGVQSMGGPSLLKHIT